MKTRRVVPAAFALAVSLLLVSSGFAAPEVKLEAPPAKGKGLRIAVLPVVNNTAEEDAGKIMEDVLRETFHEVDPAKFVFLMPEDVQRVLSDANAMDRADRVTGRWSRNGSLDSAAVGGLDSLLIADDVMCIKISEWETKRAHTVGEGQSSTTIALHFALFSIRDRRKIWSKDEREQRLAHEMDISSGTVGYDETGRIQTAGATDPPRVQDVATDLVKDALKKFPIK
jgi:hypothetical protein